jgi:hypothetical protein
LREIKLTRGFVALVDDEDFEYLNQFSWQVTNNGFTNYAKRGVYLPKINGKRRSKTIWMHREIMNISPKLQADHINRNGLDNRKENLRIVTNRENHWNLSNQGDYIGIQKIGNRYQSKIYIKNKNVHLGYFDTPELAHKAYIEKSKQLVNIEQ